MENEIKDKDMITLKFDIIKIKYPKNAKIGESEYLLETNLDNNIKSKRQLKNMVVKFINEDFAAPKTYDKKQVFHGIYNPSWANGNNSITRSKSTIYYDVYYVNKNEIINIFYRIQRVKNNWESVGI